jgi:hypothetical protein
MPQAVCCTDILEKFVTIEHIVPSNSLVGRKACITSTVFFGEQGCSPVHKELQKFEDYIIIMEAIVCVGKAEEEVIMLKIDEG